MRRGGPSYAYRAFPEPPGQRIASWQSGDLRLSSTEEEIHASCTSSARACGDRFLYFVYRTVCGTVGEGLPYLAGGAAMLLVAVLISLLKMGLWQRTRSWLVRFDVVVNE